MKKQTALFLTLLLLMTMFSALPAGAEVTLCSTDDAKLYLAECAQQLDTEISFAYTEALDDYINDSYGLMSLMYNCGLLNWNVERDTTDRTVTVRDIQYHHGFRIVEAERLGRLGELTQDELDTYYIARDIAAQALANSGSLLEAERYIHDEICRRVTYERGEGATVTDTAIGALKYGRADCDGYADAFYLTGRLAGLNVVYQLGDWVDPEGNAIVHMWNRIFLNGNWHHVDISANDPDWAEAPDFQRYNCFNAGNDLMTDYRWTRGLSYAEMSYAPATEYTDWNVYFYTCWQGGQEGFGAYYENMQDAAAYVVHQDRNGADGAHVMVRGNYPDHTYISECIAKAGPRRRSWIWTVNMGPYTIHDILFFD